MNTLRLTVAQAIVKFLAIQHSERDGDTHRDLDLPTHRPKNEHDVLHGMGEPHESTRRNREHIANLKTRLEGGQS